MDEQILLLLVSTRDFSNIRKQMLLIWNKAATSLINLKTPKHPLQLTDFMFMGRIVWG